ncbi:spore germination protein GerPE [Paenibacillus alkalitolerans]|uniref:spore germination protein GerPE n=1 Tax=Paenibacillus alkalitolerans TaxID=2799335 RepID=UPI0018F7503D|nr:spore germination protein GerPE [Paenibacillus alkalitolerans]
MGRVSLVANTKVLAVSTGSIFSVGDAVHLKPKARALAVQREVPVFLGDEGNFEKFKIFTQKIPQPEAAETINMQVHNISPWIKVGNVKIHSVAASSIFQIGSNKTIDSEARVKHIRQLLRGRRPV